MYMWLWFIRLINRFFVKFVKKVVRIASPVKKMNLEMNFERPLVQNCSRCEPDEQPVRRRPPHPRHRPPHPRHHATIKLLCCCMPTRVLPGCPYSDDAAYTMELDFQVPASRRFRWQFLRSPACASLSPLSRRLHAFNIPNVFRARKKILPCLF